MEDQYQLFAIIVIWYAYLYHESGHIIIPSTIWITASGNKDQWTHASGFGAGGTQGVNDDFGYQGVIIIEVIEEISEETTVSSP